MHTSGGPWLYILAAEPHNIQISYLWTLQLYGSMILNREREKNIGKGSQKNLWYLFLGTNEQSGCLAILWDGLSIRASVALKIHWYRDRDPRIRTKYCLSTFHWSYGSPMLMLSPWIWYFGPNPNPKLLPFPCSSAFHENKVREVKGAG